MKKTPTTNEIIEIMKQACDALKKFNEAHQDIDSCEKAERELELWSSNLCCHAATLNARIINK
jgi:hypothetical protein